MDNTINKNWEIEQMSFNADKNMFYESIFSLANGYMGMRAFDYEETGRGSHELCTYIAGIFDYLDSGITDMVNTPNFLYFRLNIDGDQFDLKDADISDYKRVLNIREGTLTRTLVWKNSKGQRTRIETVRFLSMDNIHNAVVRYKITPLNYSGCLTIETAIDAKVTNNPINDDQLKENKETVNLFNEVEKGTDKSVCYITIQTKSTKYNITEAFDVNVTQDRQKIKYRQSIIKKDKFIAKKICFKINDGRQYFIDKLIGVYTSRDEGVNDTKSQAVKCIKAAMKEGFDSIYKTNRKAWSTKWDIADIIIKGDDKAQLSIRYNIFQLIQTNAENDPTVSIGARGIMHGRYKGCYFWDTEIFMLPFYVYTNPKAAKNLLMYRYNTLPGAEKNAAAQNVEGARYAWMSSIDGSEQCSTWDIGCCEVHITADVAYSLDHYYRVCGDENFIIDYGAEIYIKTARYWRSRFTYHEEEDCYNMLFVKGPNEYGGVTSNNTFTTFMAKYNLNLAIKAVSLLKEKYAVRWRELREKIDFSDSEIEEWKIIIDKAVINYDTNTKLYIEDDNFFKQQPLDLSLFKVDDTPLYRKISFDRLQRYRLIKQADVILLMALLPDMFSDEEKRRAWDTYEPITLHDSTLSFGIHALFAARLGLMEKAMYYYEKSSRLDLDDVMNNTAQEGLHSAAFGATWQAVINGFGGVSLRKGCLDISPNMHEGWESLKFKLFYMDNLIDVSISKEEIDVILCENNKKSSESLTITVMGKQTVIFKNQVKKISVKV